MSQSPDLPEAMVLSYERRLPGDEMAWVVRWVGMWVALHGLTAVAGQLAQAWGGMLGWRGFGALKGLQQTAEIGCGIAAIVVGLGMARQRRWAWYASLALPVISLLGRVLSLGRVGSQMIGALSWISGDTLLATVQFMILMTVLARAEQAGVLQPQRRQTPGIGPAGNDITFLIQRVGWYWLAFPGFVILSLAAVPFLRSQTSAGGWWSWYSTVYVAGFGLRGVLGLLLVLQYRWALIGLAVLLPVELVASYAVMLLAFPGSTMAMSSMIGGLVQTGGMVVLLVQLYRRARA